MDAPMHEDLASGPAPSASGPDGPPPLPPPSPPSRKPRQWPGFVAGGIALVVAIALIAAAFIHVPYTIIAPGGATPLDRSVLDVKGAPTYTHRGDLLYLTVVVNNRDPNLYRYLFARLDPDTSVQKRQNVIGCASY